MNLQDLCTAIRLIPHVEFDERAAQDLIEAIRDRLQVSNFKHTDHAINAVESLEDAATILWCASEDMRAEQEAEVVHG